MNRDALLRLESLSGLTPHEMKRDHPEDFALLEARLKARLLGLVEEHFADAPPAVRDAVAKLDVEDPSAVRFDRDIGKLLDEARLDEKIDAKARARLAELARNDTPKTLLHRATPIGANPLFRTEIAEARAHRIGKLTGIGTRKIEAIRKLNVDPTQGGGRRPGGASQASSNR